MSLFSSIDQKTAEAIYEKLIEYYDNTTVIIITHQLLESMKKEAVLYLNRNKSFYPETAVSW